LLFRAVLHSAAVVASAQQSEGASAVNGIYAGLRPTADAAWLLGGALYETDLSYFPNHSFDELAAEMPHLASLNVKVIYVLPVFEAAGHGIYLIDDYFKLDPYFGGEAGLRNLVKSAHAQGIKVLLDLVTSLTPNDSYICREHPDWILHDDAAKPLRFFPFESWGWALDTTNPGLIDYFSKVVSHYVRDFDIDGWRIDFPTDNYDTTKMTTDHHRMQLLSAAKKAMTAIKPEAIFVAEMPSPDFYWGTLSPHAPPLFDRMCEASYNYPLCEFRASPGEGRIDWAALPGFAESTLPKNLQETFFYRVAGGKVNSEEFVTTVVSQDIRYGRYRANFLENHDTGRIALAYPERQAALFLLIVTMPGVPVIHAGQEFGATSPSMHTEGTESAVLSLDDASNNDLLEYYRRLMRLRARSAALQFGQMQNIWVSGDEIIAFTRIWNDEVIVAVANFKTSAAAAEIQVPMQESPRQDSMLENVLSGERLDLHGGDALIHLKPFTAACYRLVPRN